MRLFDNRRSDALLALVRDGSPMTLRQQIMLATWLSIPSVLAQFSNIAMEYIDASMVGRLGAEASASIGLVSTSTWLLWGFISSASAGFSVQVAHCIGAKQEAAARDVLRQGLTTTLIFSLCIALLGALVSPFLPGWLGGGEEIREQASAYFFIFSLSLPLYQINYLASGVLRCSGNVVVPSAMNVLSCALDVMFNFLFIFESRDVSLLGVDLHIPGVGLGVVGAALGSLCSEAIAVSIMLWFLCFRSETMRLTHEHGSFRPTGATIGKAFKIAWPMGLQHFVMTAAQVASTIIVAPLGTYSLAANSFGITAEGLCYMPGFGIADAATTLVGQSLGAKRKRLARNMAFVCVGMGIGVMSVMGLVMYFGAPLMMALLTPVGEIQTLGVSALRIEAFAEPMFAAAMVCNGAFIGAGDTLSPCIINLASMWAVRLTLAYVLAPTMELDGVWTAMCIELCVRGAAFLIRLKWGKSKLSAS